MDPKADISSHPHFVQLQKELAELRQQLEKQAAGTKRLADSEAEGGTPPRTRTQQ
jgi:hypothetical protein